MSYLDQAGTVDLLVPTWSFWKRLFKKYINKINVLLYRQAVEHRISVPYVDFYQQLSVLLYSNVYGVDCKYGLLVASILV